MVRIAYRTSCGIYGPKDVTFPKAIRDAEMQLKRCRLREHSLKRCISVLLVVAALCVCGLIVGLLATCEDQDNQEKSIGASDSKSSDDTPLATQKSNSEVSETFYDEESYTTGHTPSASEEITLTIIELSSETLLGAECTSCARTETRLSSYDIPGTVHHETYETENPTEGTSEGIDLNRTDTANLNYRFYDKNTSKASFNIQERVVSNGPPQSELRAPSLAKQGRMSSTEVQVHQPVHSKSELPFTKSTSMNEPQEQPQAETEDSPVEAITVPSKSDPIVKVSFVTTDPANCG